MYVSLKSQRAVLSIVSLICVAGCAGSGVGSTASIQSGDPRITYQNLSSTFTTSNFLVTLSASIASPTIGAQVLAADDVTVNGTNAYLSYNIPGATPMGGVDIINVTVPAVPVRLASTTLATSTVNGIYVNALGGMTVVGATSDALTSGFSSVVSQLSLSGTTISALTNTSPLLGTFAGTGVLSWNGSLYATAGDGTGSSSSYGVAVLNSSTLAQTANIPITDARALHAYAGGGTDLFVVAGGGNLYDINSSNAIAHTIVTGGNTIASSKSTVQVGQTMVAVSLGSAGAKIICQADQKTLATIPAVTVNGVDPSLTVTNAVTTGPGLLFTVNGAAGVNVYTMVSSLPTTSSCKTQTLTLIGTIDLGSNYTSANNARYSLGSLYIATGLDGFKVVTVTALAPLLGANLDFM